MCQKRCYVFWCAFEPIFISFAVLINITKGVVLTDEELSALGGGKGPCIVELELDDGSVISESLGRPSGYFVGVKAEERNAGLKITVEAKQAIIEKCYGYDLSAVTEMVMNLEKYQAVELVDAIQDALRN